MDGSITSRPESQALPLFRAPNNFLDHFSCYFGRAAHFGDLGVLGPKWPYRGIRGVTFRRNDEFRAYMWMARQFIRQILGGETRPNGAGEFRAP
jgi:hypothetical protein